MSRQHDPQSSSGSTGSSLSWEVEQVLTGHKYSRASLDSDSRARVGGRGGGCIRWGISISISIRGRWCWSSSGPELRGRCCGVDFITDCLMWTCRAAAGPSEGPSLKTCSCTAASPHLTPCDPLHSNISEHLLKCFRKEWAEALKDSSTGSGALAPLLLSTAACVHCTAAPCTFRTTSTAAEGFIN